MAQLSDEQRAEKFLHELDDNKLYCRATRRHRYPILLPPKPGKAIKLPKGFTFKPTPGRVGYIDVSLTCLICGRVCNVTTTPDNFLTHRIRRNYEDPVGYAAPKGTGKHLGGATALHELERRLNEGGLFGMPDA